jgi:hypothetical protein
VKRVRNFTLPILIITPAWPLQAKQQNKNLQSVHRNLRPLFSYFPSSIAISIRILCRAWIPHVSASTAVSHVGAAQHHSTALPCPSMSALFHGHAPLQRREYASQRASRSLRPTDSRCAERSECSCELETERETGICAADRRLLCGYQTVLII